MTTLTSGKIAEVLFENYLMTYEHQDMILDKIPIFKPDAATLQNAENFIWRTKQQHSPILEGFDLTGQEQGVIEETYPAILGEPRGDFVQQRIDKLRDITFWERRGKESGRQQATELNRRVAEAIMVQGSLFYRSNVTSSFDFIGEGQAIMNERQGYQSLRCYFLNTRTSFKFSQELAAKQTLQGRPEEAYKRGQITQNTAEFDIYTASFLPPIIGGADPATTVTATQSFKPEGGTVDQVNGNVSNVDYRRATIPVVASADYNINDKVEIRNSGTPIESVGLADKTASGQAMTFTVIGKPTGTSLTISPKPIAVDDPALTPTEAAPGNIDTRILTAATVNRLNIDLSAKSNIFFDQDAVEVLGGTVPANLFSEFSGQKVINQTMKNGQEVYLIYDSKIDDMTFRYRLFTWYGITIRDPSRCGTSISF